MPMIIAYLVRYYAYLVPSWFSEKVTIENKVLSNNYWCQRQDPYWLCKMPIKTSLTMGNGMGHGAWGIPPSVNDMLYYYSL